MFKVVKIKSPNVTLEKNKNVKIGLALGGGGARGFAHLGAIKAFEEHGLQFDFIAGTSAGALVAAFYANGWGFEDLYQLAKNFKEKDIRKSKIKFMPSSSEGIEQIIRENLGDINIEDSQIPLAIVAVDIFSTNECIIRNGNLAKAVAGSCAVPAVFQPVEFNGRLLLDGGLQNTLPSNVPKIFGADYVVGVDVNPSRTYGAKSSRYIDVLSAAIRILMKKNAETGYNYGDVVLQPETKRFRSTKMDGFEEMIDEGYNEAIEKMPEILALFNRKPSARKNRHDYSNGAELI